MAGGTPLTDDEKDQVRKLNAEGISERQIGKRLGRGQSTIHRFVEREGLTAAFKAPEAANRARSKFAEEARLEAINDGLDTGKAGLDRVLRAFNTAVDTAELEKAASAYQKVTISMATWIDKRRLEEGLPTSYGKQEWSGDDDNPIRVVVDVFGQRDPEPKRVNQPDASAK